MAPDKPWLLALMLFVYVEVCLCVCVCVIIECNNMNESQKHAKRKNPAFKGTFCMIHLYDMRGEGKGELQEYRDQNQIQSYQGP